MAVRTISAGPMALLFAFGVLGLAGLSAAAQPQPPGETPPQPGAGSQLAAPPRPGGPGEPSGGGFPGGPPGSSVPGGFPGSGGPGGPGPRFHFTIAPNTPVKDLLPTPPAVKSVKGPVVTDDLRAIPEVEFQTRPAKPADVNKSAEAIAHQLAKITHLNAKKTDAFMAALLENRPELAGLPFSMGDDCRTTGERSKQFTIAVNTVRQAMGGGGGGVFPQFGGPGFPGVGGPPGGGPGFGFSGPGMPQATVNVVGPGSFWTQYPALCDQQDAARGRTDRALREHVTVARIAALMQMFAPESGEMRLGLVKYLTGVPHVESTKALARLAIYSPEADVRAAAVESLKIRREKDYTDVLVKGLRYPWPAVARRAAEAISATGRTDLIPELVAVLGEEDPRMPAAREKGGKKVSVVREMVRVNHHRNCMMCHAPTSSGSPSDVALTAEVPVPGQPLPTPSQGYGQSLPDLMVRIDVTYLRQDFSAVLPVGDDKPWPEQQRFDFIVRERALAADEAAEYRAQLTPREAGELSPYHKAALAALRELTGKDTAPTAEAWRKLLNIKKTD
jgi:hypothetical protein